MAVVDSEGEVEAEVELAVAVGEDLAAVAVAVELAVAEAEAEVFRAEEAVEHLDRPVDFPEEPDHQSAVRPPLIAPVAALPGHRCLSLDHPLAPASMPEVDRGRQFSPATCQMRVVDPGLLRDRQRCRQIGRERALGRAQAWDHDLQRFPEPGPERDREMESHPGRPLCPVPDLAGGMRSVPGHQHFPEQVLLSARELVQALRIGQGTHSPDLVAVGLEHGFRTRAPAYRIEWRIVPRLWKIEGQI